MSRTKEFRKLCSGRNNIYVLHGAIRNNSVIIVRWLLTRGVNIERRLGDYNALNEAVHWASKEIVEILLDHGADPNVQDNNSCTPLHIAVLNESVEIVRCLLDRNVDLEIRDDIGETPLLTAARSGSDKITRLLLGAKVNPSTLNDVGRTPLHIAAMYGFREIADMLLAYGSDVLVKETIFGNTPLHCAANGGYWDIAHSLLPYYGAYIPTNDSFETPLHTAVKFGYIDFLRQLLNYIKQNWDLSILNAQRRPDGFTALRIAIHRGSLHISQMLLENGASFTICSNNGKSDLDAALESDYEDIRKLGQDFKQLMALDKRPSLPSLLPHSLSSWS